MMKLAVTALTLFLVLSPSQAKTTTVEKVSVSQKHSVLKTPTRTRSVVVLAVPKAQRRLLVTNDIDDRDDGPPGPDELDLQSLYRRPRVSELPHTDDSISDYITVRLAVARARALTTYSKHWG
jgi:hypothetical protein